MKTHFYLLAVVLAVAAGQSSFGQASSGSNQGSGAYGNNTYNAGAQQSAPAKSNNAQTTAPGKPANPPNSANSQSQGQNAPSTSGQGSPLTPTASDNGALQSRIEEALRKEPTLGSSHLTVAVTDNSIDLGGTVSSSKDRTTAERIAASFDGNRKLNNNVVATGGVRPNVTPAKPATGNAPNSSTNGGSNPQR